MKAIIDVEWNEKHGACYPGARLRALYDRPMTPLEVCERRDGPWADVSSRDRFWVLTRPGLLDGRVLRLAACHVARMALDSALEAGREPDARSWQAVEVAERYAEGKATAKELADAAAEAEAAAAAAETAEAWTAWQATKSAAYAAAWAAAADAQEAVGDGIYVAAVEFLADQLQKEQWK